MSSPRIKAILTLRLKRACALLADTDLSVTEIGIACGFGSTSYFTKLFHQQYGLTPGEYRSKRGQGDAFPSSFH